MGASNDLLSLSTESKDPFRLNPQLGDCTSEPFRIQSPRTQTCTRTHEIREIKKTNMINMHTYT